MGYYTRVDGTLSFVPALTDDQRVEIADILMANYLVDGPEDVDKHGVYFEFYGKAYGIDDGVNALVNEAVRLGVNVKGEITGVGEEMPDIWRILVKDNRVVRETVKMVWPDGTEYHG